MDEVSYVQVLPRWGQTRFANLLLRKELEFSPIPYREKHIHWGKTRLIQLQADFLTRGARTSCAIIRQPVPESFAPGFSTVGAEPLSNHQRKHSGQQL